MIVNGAMDYRNTQSTEGDLARGLADHHTVITYDRRGRGESGPTDPSLTVDAAIRAEVADIAALIDQVGGTAAVLGFSSGGVLALHGVQAGLPITALALWEPPFIVTDARPPLAEGYRERVQQALADGRPGDAAPCSSSKPARSPNRPSRRCAPSPTGRACSRSHPRCPTTPPPWATP
ncbi:alpha/beta fold hydrolase [Nonomuraea phyllanthi]|uniref:Alpha/beta fold hydrolase n=1 Tax=Nonomuraea phyllanthi TaxID=2219224 RepID=A0A5C4UX69_9ACTN|nr:alpha/beta hydrolase [Nonomuraea phyllanthi]KAB8182983.1 alpha/beta fold hydrolase [Nonomuraea phyllanthi]